jgi:tetratricopeptide (TPR) repeat protein
MHGPLTDRSFMRKFMAIGVLAAAWGFVLPGCGEKDNNGAMTGVASDKALNMNGERNGFENSEDPPIKAQTHYAAGQVSESQGDYPGAIKQYKEALKLNPKLKGAVYREAICLSHLKKFPEAVASWRRYIELTDGDVRGYSNLGFCYELAGQTDEAEAAYLRGIEKDPKNVPCRTNYGLMLARLNRTAEAKLQLQAVLSPAEVHYNLASVLEHQGRREAARQEYQKALSLDPNLTEAQQRLSELK